MRTYRSIEGSLISAEALFCRRALFAATWIHPYTRMASFIRRVREQPLRHSSGWVCVWGGGGGVARVGCLSVSAFQARFYQFLYQFFIKIASLEALFKGF